MNSILIVDDEPRVLQGLRRMLRGMQGQWHIEFAEGGIEALKRLFDFPFDVVLTDMRMPNIDGAELLTEIRRLCPETVRIILSGQCDDDTVIKCVEPAHQFLAKPCDSNTIKETVRTACSLRKRLSDPLLQRETSRITTIPCLASSYERLMAALAAESPSLESIEEIVANDIGMTAKIMQLVSSCFFGSPRRAIGIRQAVWLLGVNRFKLLASESDCFRPLTDRKVGGREPLTMCRDHAVLVARRARAVAEAAGADPVVRDHAYLSGMLHSLSTFVVGEDGAPLFDAQLSSRCLVHGVAPPHRPGGCGRPAQCLADTPVYAEVSGCLLALWGLPSPVVEAVSHYRRPSAVGGDTFSSLAALHVAHAMTAKCAEPLPRTREATRSALDSEYLERIGRAHQVDAWLDRCYRIAAAPPRYVGSESVHDA